MDSVVFQGPLSFHANQVHRSIDLTSQTVMDPGTRSKIFTVDGRLEGLQVGHARLSLHIQVSRCTFHDERWEMFTIVGDNDSLSSIRFGRTRRPQGGFTGIHLTDENMFDVCEEMNNFELALFSNTGVLTHRTHPFRNDLWMCLVHERAALIFASDRVSALVLAAVLQFTPLMNNSIRYQHRVSPGASFAHRDEGISLRESARWRSTSVLYALLEEGFDSVPASIRPEIEELCSHLPRKRDHGDTRVRHNDYPNDRAATLSPDALARGMALRNELFGTLVHLSSEDRQLQSTVPILSDSCFPHCSPGADEANEGGKRLRYASAPSDVEDAQLSSSSVTNAGTQTSVEEGHLCLLRAQLEDAISCTTTARRRYLEDRRTLEQSLHTYIAAEQRESNLRARIAFMERLNDANF